MAEERWTEAPVKMQTADPNKMMCRDCIYRDQEEMVLNGKKVRIGIMRDTCLIFDGKRGRWKPTAVVLQNKPCDFYVRDENAERFWERKGKK